MSTFLDTNILIYLLDHSSSHHEWAVDQFTRCRAIGPAMISDIVYCEFSVGMPSKEATDRAIEELAIERVRGTSDALFQAGRAFKSYKAAGGEKNRVLADFVIGAIASVAEASLITVNAADFTGYFPRLRLISP